MIVAYAKETGSTALVTGVYYGEVVLPEDGNYIEGAFELPQQGDLPNLDPVLKIDLSTTILYYDYVSRDSVFAQLGDLQKKLTEAEGINKRLAEESNANQLALMELHMLVLSVVSPDEG
ncbi:hypothetical protein [Paenibacillus sp. FSL R7-0026]|uniref:hypothetical protein n=1 Tax=Paenibacillus sp. FSL R7-0026 TaxID=2921668 RepID=UPI0030FAEA4C